jgi:hypothetical protein
MPLSEYEQRVLDEMERQLSSDDPKLAGSMHAPAGARRGRVMAGLFVFAIGLAILVVGMAVSLIWLSVAGFLLMFAGGLVAVAAPRSKAGAPKAPRPRRPGLGERFEERWERRQNGD